jgi:hypothetical protein
VWHQLITSTEPPPPDPEPEPEPQPPAENALPSVPDATGIRLSGAYLQGPTTVDFTGAFTVGGLWRPLTPPVAGTTTQRLWQKVDDPDGVNEAGVITWLTTQFVRMARVAAADYRSVWVDTGTEPQYGQWHQWAWRYDPTAPNPDNPPGTATPSGRSAFFLDGQLMAERDTHEITVPATTAPFLVGAKADGTGAFLGELTRIWVIEGAAMADAWFGNLEQARLTGQTALSNLRASPTSVAVQTTSGSTTVINRSVVVTQNAENGNPAFTVSAPSAVTVTGGLIAPTTLNFAINPTGLTTDTTLTVTITPADTTQPAFTVPVVVDVVGSDMRALPETITLNAPAGAATSNTVRLTITQHIVGGPTDFTITSPADWLQITEVN